MIRSGTIHTIQELSMQGKSIHAIARELGIARNTVRKYLRGAPQAVPRPKRGSKLDPYKETIRQWVYQDHLLNCEVMLPRLQALGYTGSSAILRAYVHTLRPKRGSHSQPVIRYETQPGEQMQFDWAELTYEHAGKMSKVYAFTAILSYSRMRFATFVKRCDAPTMIRSMMLAFEYFGGLPQSALTDRMKSVFLDMDGSTPIWNPLFADFMAAIGVVPRVCKPYKPQTKGKVERTVRYIKYNFWPGISFTDIDDLNEQVARWCDRINQKVHRTTGRVPMDAWVEEQLAALPPAFAWERFGAEERKVSWDGFFSYDGVLYGLPAQAGATGSVVLVREHHGSLRVFSQGTLIATLAKCPRSQEIIYHPEQFASLTPTLPLTKRDKPLGHQIDAPLVSVRPLTEYDHLFGIEVQS